MKRTVILSLIGILSSAVSLQAQAATGDVEKTVAALEQKWTDTQNANDSAREAQYVADTLVVVDQDGTVFKKDQYIADEKATKYTHVAIENMIVHAYGTTAIATYTWVAKGTGSNGKPMDVRERVTDTWVKMPDGKWQCVASVGSPLKA